MAGKYAPYTAGYLYRRRSHTVFIVVGSDAVSPDQVPLRPHIGIMAVMPNNTLNWGGAGASTLPPSRFGGNVDDWRIGPGGSMYYRVEVPGANLVLADTHAAMGDTELAGTAMETSMTVQIQVWVHKAADGLPTKVGGLSYPMLETQDSYIIHGFAYNNYLDDLATPRRGRNRKE